MMHRWNTKKNNSSAVSEIVGTILLLGISVAFFTIVYISVLTVPESPPTPSANIACRINGGVLVIEHCGGKGLNLDTQVLITIDDESPFQIAIGDYLDSSAKSDNLWSTGETIEYSSGEFLGNNVEIDIIDLNSNSIVSTGKFVVPTQNFTLTIYISGNGDVDKNPDEMDYPYGTDVTLTPNPDTDWDFIGWEEDLTGSSNPGTITIKKNSMVKAIFKEIFTLVLTKNGTGTGTIEASPPGPYHFGDEVIIYANASTGSAFAGFSGDLTGISSPQTIMITNDKNVNAEFTLGGPFDLTLTKSGTGAGSIEASPAGPYYYGTEVTIWANASTGSSFTTFNGDITETTSPQTLVMDGAKSVDALFTLNGPYALTLTKSGDGSGTIEASPTGPYYYGAQVTIWANASTGSLFTGFNGGLTGTTTPQIITMDEDKNVDAQFNLIYTLSLSTSGSGSGTIQASPSGPYASGSLVTIWANASACSSFTGFTGDLTGPTTPQTITMDEDKTVDAQFTLLGPYTLTLTTSGTGSGTIQASPSGPYNCGDVVTIWANASTGSSFTGFSGDLTGTTTPETIIINTDKSVNTEFNLIIPEPPSSFTANENGQNRIDLTWTKGTDSTHTYIRYTQGSTPPATRTSGIYLYNNTGTSTSATNLSSDTQYSFSAWSYNSISGSWSITYSSDSAKTDEEGGCAFIYSWDGEMYHPEHAISDFAVHRFFEYPTYGLLPNLRNINGTYKFAVWEQVPETQYLDTLELWEVIHPIGTEIVPEQATGIIHTISNKQYPDVALGTDGESYVDELSKPDEKYWVTNLSIVDLDDPQLWDTLDIVFYASSHEKPLASIYNFLGIPLPTREVKLVVRGKDTGLLSEAWTNMITAIEPDYTRYEILNTNMSIFENISNWAMTTGQLHLYKEGENIHSFMFGNPEFYHTWAIKFNYTLGEDIKLQFVGGTYGHQIDEMYVDKTPDKKLEIIQLQADIIEYNLKDSSQDPEELISQRDYNYLLMEQGDYMICTFDSNTSVDNMSSTPLVFANAYSESYSCGKIITEQNISLAKEIWQNPGLDRVLFIKPFVENLRPVLSTGMAPKYEIP